MCVCHTHTHIVSLFLLGEQNRQTRTRQVSGRRARNTKSYLIPLSVIPLTLPLSRSLFLSRFQAYWRKERVPWRETISITRNTVDTAVTAKPKAANTASYPLGNPTSQTREKSSRFRLEEDTGRRLLRTWDKPRQVSCSVLRWYLEQLPRENRPRVYSSPRATTEKHIVVDIGLH